MVMSRENVFNTFSFHLQLWSLQTEGNSASLCNAYFQGVTTIQVFILSFAPYFT